MSMLKRLIAGIHTLPLLLGAIVIAVPLCSPRAQSPFADSLKALQLRNEKMYRQVNSLDDKGADYGFTNVTAWKITDPDLSEQIKKIYTAQYGDRQLKNFDIADIYLFNAPAGMNASGDTRFMPFHVLFMGQVRRETEDTSGGGGQQDIFFGGGKRRGNTNEKVPRAFKGREVIRIMSRQPALLDNINAIQGDLVELPGDILKSGVQIISSSAERYILHQMFTGFYSKRLINDEVRKNIGLPTSEEALTSDTAVVDENAAVPDPSVATSALPDESSSSRAFRYDKVVDLSLDHLLVNIGRNNALELEMGDREVGLPFWSSGEARVWLNMKNQVGTESNFKLGFAFPITFGTSDNLLFKSRKLSGSYGGSIDAYFAGIDFFSAFNMPLAFNFTVLPSQGENGSTLYNGATQYILYAKDGQAVTIPANRTFYHTSFMGQLYIPIAIQLDPSTFVQLSAGFGVQTIYHSWIPNDDDLAVGGKSGANGLFKGTGGAPDGMQSGITNDLERVGTPVTPHVALQYVNHRTNKFGLNFQYDHLFTFGGWIELIQDHLRIEASYTAPVVRDAHPWEPANFFEITPRFYF